MMVRGKIRSLLQALHRYVGLWCGAIFVLLGLTGSAIAWLHELDSALNPDLFRAVSASAASEPARASAETVQRVCQRLAADPQYGQPAQLHLPQHAGDVFIAWYRRGPRNPSLAAQDISRQVMVDPTTLRILGERPWGELGLSRRLLMPTLFHLHRYLAAGEIGKTVIGLSGLLMVAIGITGLALGLFKLKRQALWQALRISCRGSWPRFHFSFHRAAGFFVAPVLIVQGVSGTYFNLPEWIAPLLGRMLAISPIEKLHNRAPAHGEPLLPGKAVAIAQALYPTARVSRVSFPGKSTAPYEIRFRQPGEIRQGDGATRITIDAYSGEVLRTRDPLRSPPGDTLLNWLFPLHSGEAFGMAGRAFVSGLGVAPLLFLVTGAGIWLSRRRKQRAPSASASGGNRG